MQMGENDLDHERHTAEPWTVHIRSSDGLIQIRADSEDLALAVVSGYGPAPHEANARRIVLCVNACRGLSDHYLESRQDGEIRDELVHYNRLAVEHARLAEAARAVLTWYDDARRVGHGYNPAGEMANLRAALNPPAPEDSAR